jgi:tRNA pseudouridine38-40 synthase
MSVEAFESVRQFWSRIIRGEETVPTFLTGARDGSYGITNLDAIHELGGNEEFDSRDPRFKRQTFALRIGYDGSQYVGYQMQPISDGPTVERDLRAALQVKGLVAAGRTDKHVSAISQIVSFHTFEDLSPEDLIAKINQSEGCRQGRLRAFHAVRVPKRFHALFSATWRRYIYLYPYDESIDTSFIAGALKRLEGELLPYNAFAWREDRRDDCECIIYRGEVCSTLVDISPSHDGSLTAFAIELVGNRFLRRMVRNIVATVVREASLLPEVRNINILKDVALSGERARAAPSAPGEGLGNL